MRRVRTKKNEFKFKWHYRSFGTPWSAWVETEIFSQRDQDIKLIELEDPNKLCFYVRVKANRQYTAVITYGKENTKEMFENNYFTSQVNMDTKGEKSGNFILEVIRLQKFKRQ